METENMKKEEKTVLVKKKKIKEAVKVLKKYVQKWNEEHPSRKLSLLEEPSQTPVLLHLIMKKVPESSKLQAIKVILPHTMLTDLSEVCLFTGDLDRRDRKADIEPTVQHYKELLSKHGIKCVSEVIPLRQLRTEYKPYEAKIKLCGAYDFFLNDNRITQCLPSLLGKWFIKKRKFPIQISMTTSNLKNQVENALSKTVFFLNGRGNSCSSQVAHLGFSTKEISENIEATITALAANIPGSWENVNGIYIKTPFSVSIPIYVSFESGNDVKLPPPETVEDVEAEELSTVMGYKVKVYGDGNIELVKTDEVLSDGEADHDCAEALDDYDKPKHKKLRRRKKTLSESDDDDEEEEEEEEEEKETFARRNEKLKEKVPTEKPKSMMKKKKKLSMDEVCDDETETVLTKEEVPTEKQKSVMKKKKKRCMDEVCDDETVLTKEEVSTEKPKSTMKKKKKRYMDEVCDDETETVLTKKKVSK